jgi:hypothetical protein
MLTDSLSRKAELDAALSRIEAAIEDYMEDRFGGRGQDDGDSLYTRLCSVTTLAPTTTPCGLPAHPKKQPG